jgi:hypothetical protein
MYIHSSYRAYSTFAPAFTVSTCILSAGTSLSTRTYILLTTGAASTRKIARLGCCSTASNGSDRVWILGFGLAPMPICARPVTALMSIIYTYVHMYILSAGDFSTKYRYPSDSSTTNSSLAESRRLEEHRRLRIPMAPSQGSG